ncbi:hypothetical protein PQR33_32960 [Paraburkholderia sediminicola]|uniref:hypothetical protein n=1 Tax=Paraburkholderia sediminicola TaxID=458836 RepID=UPI0038BC8FE0
MKSKPSDKAAEQQRGCGDSRSGQREQSNESDQLAAMMAFPNDEPARMAFALYLRLDRTAAQGNSLVLSADEYLFLTNSAEFSRPEIMQRAKKATAKGMAAAWPFVQTFLSAPDSNPSLAKAYREAQEFKDASYAATKLTLTERFADVDSDRVDRKYFEELKREFATVLHFWMAHLIINAATDRGPDPTDTKKFSAFLLGAERCAEYLASISYQNRHAPPVDISQLYRMPIPR